MELVDTKYVDIKIVEGKLVLEVDAKKVAVENLKPVIEKVFSKVAGAIPGEYDDALLNALKEKIFKEIEAL